MTATLTKKRKQTGGITLPTDSMKRALATVKAAVPSRTPKPVLNNVLLHNGGLTATDLELQVSAEIPWNADPLLLPFARLQAILVAATGDEVTLTPNGTSCTVQIGRGEWTLPTEDAAEFPRWQPDAVKRLCTIPADQFVRAVRSVVYATDNESNRFALGAVLVEVDRSKSMVTFVGTDGRRLSQFEIELSNNEDPDSSTTLIPARAIKTIESIALHSEGAVQLEATANEAIATIDGTVVTARLVEGRFPRWRDSIPERDVKASLVSSAAMLAATRQAAIVTSEQSKGVSFAFTPEGIHLTAKSTEAGQASVTCEHLEHGQAATVNLDPRFVVEFLRSVDESEPVEIEAAGPGDAVVLRCGDCTGVIMPLAKD